MSDLPRIAVIERSAVAARQLAQTLTEISGCEAVPFDNARDALIGISRNPPELIIVEWDLADIDVSELITAFGAHPDLHTIPVIVISSRPMEEVTPRARNLGARTVLSKPIGRQNLRRALESIIPASLNSSTWKDKAMIGDIRSEIKNIDKLAPLPTLVKTIMEVSSDPNSSARALAEVIKMDQSLTAKILHIVNSAYYGFYRQIGNIDHAVVILGFNEVTSISLAACIIQAYRNGPNPYIEREQFWIHTLGAAYIARSLRSYTPDIISKDAFVIGLLHDIGKVVLDQHFKDAFVKVLTTAHRENTALHLAEQKILGLDHAEIGGMVAESWNLPQSLADGIRYHHIPEMRRDDYAVHLAHLANWFAHRHEIGQSGNPAPGEPNPLSLTALGFEGKDLDDIWASLNIDAQSLKRIL